MADAPKLVVQVGANLDDLTQKLAAQLGLIDGTADSFEKLSTSFDGGKVVQQATMAAAAIDQLGGVSRLASDELTKSNKLFTEAAEAAGRMGDQGTKAAAMFQTLADGTRPASEGGKEITEQFRKFDETLASLGIHIRPEILALGELADASGKTAAGMGLLGTAGLVAGAGLAGWKVGRLISDFFDLDKTIGDATAKLLGWGDAQGQAAGANADALAAASKRVGFEIHSLSDAMMINAAASADWRTNAEISAATVAKWQGELDKVRQSGDLQSLTDDLASHNFSLQELSKRYGASVEALQLFQRETRAAAAADDAATATIQKNNQVKLQHLREEFAAAQQWNKVLVDVAAATGGLQGALDTIDGRIVDWAEHLLASGVSAQEVAKYYGLTDVQVKALEWDLRHNAEAARDHAKAIDQDAESLKRLADAAAQAQAKMVAAFNATNSAIMGMSTSFAGWNAAVMGASSMATAALTGNLNSQAKTVETLGGAWITAADAKKAFDSGGSFALQALSDDDLKRIYGSLEAAKARLEYIKQYYAMYPGAQAGVDGLTGLLANDAAGWTRLLQMQQEYAQLQTALAKTTKDTAETITTATKQGLDAVTAMSAAAAGSVNSAVGASVSAMQRVAAAWSGLNLSNAGPITTHLFDGPSTVGGGYATGVQNAPGGLAIVGERGPEIMEVPRGANIYPSGTGPMGSSVTMAAGAVQVTLNYPIMRDQRAQAELADIVGDALKKKLIGLGVRFPSGA